MGSSFAVLSKAGLPKKNQPPATGHRGLVDRGDRQCDGLWGLGDFVSCAWVGCALGVCDGLGAFDLVLFACVGCGFFVGCVGCGFLVGCAGWVGCAGCV